MIESLVFFLEKVIVPYGALGVFTATFIEEVIAFIPSTVVLLASGFLFLSDNVFSVSYLSELLLIIVIPAALGMTLGSLVMYGIGYVSGKPAISRFGKYFGISWNDVEKAEARFSKSSGDEIALVLARAFPVIPNTAISALCGLIRFPILKYSLLSFIGLGIRALVLGVIGAEVGVVYKTYSQSFEVAEKYILAGLAVVALVFLFVMFARKKKSREA